MKKIILIGAGLVMILANYAFTGDWKTEMPQMISDFINCNSQSKGAECKTYVAKAIKAVYGINDFDAPAKPGGALDINAVANYIKKDSKWKLLGDASSADVLTQAQASANSNKAVVAMMVSDNGADHIAIIIPGNLVSCGQGVKYPNSISFFVNNPAKSYWGKPLAYSFKNLEGIKIYVRN